MNDSDLTGSDWSDHEIDLVVVDYFEMLRMERVGQAYVKAERNRALQELTHRSRGSIEFKHQNISAVLLQLGMDWIPGYKPMANFQKALLRGIERYIDNETNILVAPIPVSSFGLSEDSTLYFESPPSIDTVHTDQEPIKRLVRKFDPAARDAENRALGKRGEERVFFSERARLKAEGRTDLASKVRWISEEDGDGAGFDIRSFDENGAERLLEVKTTIGSRVTPFFLTENERQVSIERPHDFRLVRLYEFSRKPKAFQLVPPLEHAVVLKPAIYKASFEP